MYAMNYAQVGANIQRILHEKGLTQQELADSLAISKQVMSKIVKGAKAINVAELSKIATKLNTTTDDLLTIDELSLPTEVLSFMGAIHDEETREKVDLIRSAIDEIHLLEDLTNE